MDEHYLTDQICLKDKKLFYEDKVIKSHHWQNLLKDYGWEKLHKRWITKLNGYLEKPSRNSLFGSLDCGGEGDCLFHCLSYAIHEGHIFENDSHSLRNLLSESITEEKFNEIISIYRILNESNDFDEDWNPETITFNEFKEKIVEGGNEYWGDNILVNLLKEVLEINIIILNSNEYANEFYNYPLLYDYDKDINTVILLYENNIHFKLIGHFKDNNMTYFFNNKNIPEEILKLNNFVR